MAKVSYKKIEKVIKEKWDDKVTIDWNGVEIDVKPMISLADMSALVTAVAENCFSEDDNSYHPEFKDFLFKLGVITYFTNISLPEDSEKQFKLIERGDLYTAIEVYIDEEFLFDINFAIDEKIKYLIKMNVETVNARIMEQYDSVEDVVQKLAEISETITDDDIKKLIDVFTGDHFEVNEAALAEAIVNLRK